MTEAQEKKSRKIAMITSLGLHSLLLLLLLFMVAWRAPNPPLPEFGIELNFGMDTRGTGAIQPETPPASQSDEPEQEEEVVEDLPVPEQEEVTEEQIVEEPAPAEIKSEQPEVVAKTESPVVVEEKKEVKPVERPKEKPVEKKPEVKEIPKAVYKPRTDAKTEGQAGDKPGTPSSHGDDVNEPGDKGDPQGTLDSKALYGKHGGGGGGVSMSGFGTFGYPDIVTPEVPNESNGIYRFKVKVDEEGYVVSVVSLERGINAEAERRLRATIQNLRFIPKGNPVASEGEITFRIVSK